MKKWIIVFFIIIILISAGIFYWKKSPPKSPDKVLSATQALTPTPTPRIWKQSDVLNIDGIPMRISWTIVQPKNVELYDNLKEQHLSEQIKVDKSCSVLVNGGFYSEDNKHLGLFVTNFEIISKTSQNATRNGFLWIDSSNKVIISSDPPNITPHLGLQSGPLLIFNKKPLVLSINNDSAERRIVAATTSDNQLYFLAVYRDGSEYQGPLLGTLPEIIDQFAKKNNIDLWDAINLDGGIHSIFISSYDRLVELAHVGSYFCIK